MKKYFYVLNFLFFFLAFFFSGKTFSQNLSQKPIEKKNYERGEILFQLKKNFSKKDFEKKISEKKFEKKNFETESIFREKKICLTFTKLEMSILLEKAIITSQEKNIAFLDAAILKLPMRIRTTIEGDRFQPLGMHGQSKLLSDFFRSLKLSEFEKEQQLVLTDVDDNIVWVLGQRADERFKVTDTTINVWQIKMEQNL